MTEPISTVPAITTTPDVAEVKAEQNFIDGSGSEKYGASDWTAATGAGLDYPGGAIFDPTPSSPERLSLRLRLRQPKPKPRPPKSRPIPSTSKASAFWLTRQRGLNITKA